MHLKQLDIVGFKSFVEASVTLGPGITALVGPNGTGKSNLVDAVLWALGEQAPRTLRTERMEDVIFSGAASTPSMGMAEVVLTFTDLPRGQSDVTISRRLFRNGQSEYAINTTPCRLRDVRDLLFDLGASSKGCTVIEQGKLDVLLQSSAQDRRAMIEDVAGTIRYKKQRTATMQKIEASRGNLLRLRDVIGELKRQYGTLQRQARAAERYTVIRDEIRMLELSLLQHDYDSHHDHLDAIETQLALAKEQEATLSARLAAIKTDHQRTCHRAAEAETTLSLAKDAETGSRISLERAMEKREHQRRLASMYQAQLQQITASLTQTKNDDRSDDARRRDCQRTLNDAQRATEETEAVCASHEADLKHAQERHRMLQVEIEQLRTASRDVIMMEHNEAQSISAMEARRHELAIRQQQAEEDDESTTRSLAYAAKQQQDLATHISEIQQQCAQYHIQAREHASMLQTLHASHTKLLEEATIANEQIAMLQSRHTALQEVVAEQWPIYGNTHTLQLSAAGVRGMIADVLQVPPQYERAIEAALGNRLHGILVDEHAHVLDVIDLFRTNGLAAGTFIPMHPRVRPHVTHHGTAHPGIVAIAKEIVTTTTAFQSTINSLLDSVIIVDTLHHALQLWEHNDTDPPPPHTHAELFVTLAGEYVDAAGIVGAGFASAAAGFLQRQRETKENEKQLAAARKRATAVRVESETLAETIEHHIQQQREHEAIIRDAEIRLLNMQKDKEQTDQELDRYRATHQHLTDLLRTHRETLASVAQQLADACRRKKTFTNDRVIIDQRLTQRQQDGQVSQDTLQTTLERVHNARLEQHRLLARHDGLQTELANLQGALQNRAEKITQLEHEQLNTTEQWHAIRADMVQLEDTIHAFNAAMRSQANAVATAQAHMDQIAALTRTYDTARANTQTVLETIRQTRHELSVSRAEHITSLDHIATVLAETYDVPPHALQKQVGTTRHIDVGQTRALLAQRRQQRDRLGPINLAATEESQTLEQRLSFLTAEEHDLLQSIASLEDIMTRLNATTSQLFQETLHALQKTFNDLFGRLFNGGMANLVLDDPDPVTAGVDIVAQPPGKRLKQLSMLSGGEKALTAVALTLAMYLIRPTPLCVLDETDAALDDENVARFVRILHEVAASAQFLIITHNKQTMTAADTLYGTTMAEPGITILLSTSLEHA